jgi:outer membrane protein assembly factor BamB
MLDSLKPCGAFAALIVAALVAFSEARADDWPQFRGPQRDGRSAESGLLKAWPEGGPRLIRTIEGIGTGYSSVAVVGKRIHVSGKVGDEIKLFCFDLQGKKLWETSNGEAFTRSYPGSRATVTVAGDMLFLMNGNGHLFAYRAASGKRRWTVDITERFKGKIPSWGYAESILADGKNIICCPGGKDASFVALSRKSGRVAWTSKGLSDGVHYASPILFEFKRTRIIANLTTRGLTAVNAKNGKFLWVFPRTKPKTAGVPNAVHADGYVFQANGYGVGGGAVKLTGKGSKIKAVPAWETKDMVCHHGGYVIVDSHLYGNNGGGWACIELVSGTTKWKGRGPGKGSVIYADGHLYCFGENGTMGLLEANPEGYRMLSSFQLPNAGRQTWAHPAIANGVLYLRREGKLFLYDIKAHNLSKKNRLSRPPTDSEEKALSTRFRARDA